MFPQTHEQASPLQPCPEHRARAVTVPRAVAVPRAVTVPRAAQRGLCKARARPELGAVGMAASPSSLSPRLLLMLVLTFMLARAAACTQGGTAPRGTSATPGCPRSVGGGVCYSPVRQINGHSQCKAHGSSARCAPLLLSCNINQKGLCVILEF